MHKRKRPITACLECQRQKRKCDRQRPCGNCCARNAREKCSYQSAVDHTGFARVRPTDSIHHTEGVSLSDGMGYAQTSKSRTALDELQNRGQHHDVRTASTPWPDLTMKAMPSAGYEDLVARLPSEAIIDELIEIFFAEVDWYFCVLDRPYFEELRAAWVIRRRCGPGAGGPNNGKDERLMIFGRTVKDIWYFPALLFQVLALTLHFLSPGGTGRDLLKLEDQPAADSLSKHYSDAGADIVSILGRIDSSITSVLADLLRCAWLKNSGLGSRAWHSLTEAVRQAQTLGLHLHEDVHQSGSLDVTIRNLWYDEFRRRVWVSLFSWEGHMSLMLGYSRIINAGDCTMQRPMDCDIPKDPSQVVPTPAVVSGRPSLYTSQLFKYDCSVNIHQMMSDGVFKSPCKDYTKVLGWHQKILDEANVLPGFSNPTNPDVSWDNEYPHLPKQRQHISVIVSSSIMALHRPHVTTHPASRREAITAALECLAAQQRLFELCDERHHKIHTLVFYSLDVGMFLISMALKYTETSEREGVPVFEIRDALNLAQIRLDNMRIRSDVAREAAKVLRRCHKAVADRISTSQSECQLELNGFSFDGFPKPWKVSPPLHDEAKLSQLLMPTSAQQDFDSTTVPVSMFQTPLEYSENTSFLNDASNAALWMEQNGFVDDTLSQYIARTGQNGSYW